jgi:hypothetical protein
MLNFFFKYKFVNNLMIYILLCLAPYPLATVLAIEYSINTRPVIFIQILITLLILNKHLFKCLKSPKIKLFLIISSCLFTFKLFHSLGSGYLLIFYLLFGYLVLFNLDQFSKFQININVFIVISFLILVLSYFIFIDNLDEFLNIRKRMYGGFASNSMIALYSGLVLLFSSCSKKLYAKIISFFCILILLHLANRTAILATLVGFLVILFNYERPLKTIIPLYTSYLFSIYTFSKLFKLEDVFFQSFYRFRLTGSDQVSIQDYSSGRVDSIKYYLDLFIEGLPNNLLLGNPMGTSQALSASNQTIYVAHNVPLYYIVEFGLFGFGLFLIMHFFYFKKTFLQFKMNNSLPLAITLFYLTASFFLNISSYPLIFLFILFTFKNKDNHV